MQLQQIPLCTLDPNNNKLFVHGIIKLLMNHYYYLLCGHNTYCFLLLGMVGHPFQSKKQQGQTNPLHRQNVEVILQTFEEIPGS